jgi:hypothetical protein
VSVCVMCGVVSKAEGGSARGVGVVDVLPDGPRPLRRAFGGSTEGACQSESLRPTRHQGGTSRVALPMVAERIMCAVVAAPTATPASVRIDSRCPAADSSSTGGQSGG